MVKSNATSASTRKCQVGTNQGWPLLWPILSPGTSPCPGDKVETQARARAGLPTKAGLAGWGSGHKEGSVSAEIPSTQEATTGMWGN